MTKKEYKKPTITKREKLGKVTAGAVASAPAAAAEEAAK